MRSCTAVQNKLLLKSFTDLVNFNIINNVERLSLFQAIYCLFY